MENESSYLPAASPTPTARHDGWTPERQRGFCETLAECGRVEQAALSVGMTREGAYKLRRRAAGRAFAIAWDAALLLARQRLIDETFELAFEGASERIMRDGKVIGERRRRDPRILLATLARLNTPSVLGNAPAQVAAQEFEEFLDCLESDATHSTAESAEFMKRRAEWGPQHLRSHLQSSGTLLARTTLASDDSAGR